MKVDGGLFLGARTLGVAVSGGKDSMALMHFLHRNYKSLTIKAIHINHNIREASQDDKRLVENYCKSLGIELVYYEVERGYFDQCEGGSLENNAREVRLGFFRELLKKGIVERIATAHHCSDNAESILLHIIRGAGANGARGIEQSQNGIIRPMLNVKREEIDDYVSKNDIPFLTDESNLESTFSRNYLRNEIMPLLKKRFDRVEESICRFGILKGIDDEFIMLCTPEPTRLGRATVRIDKEHFGLHTAVLSRLIFKALSILGMEKDIEKKHIDMLIAATATDTSGQSLEIKKELTVIKDAKGLVFSTGEKSREDLINELRHYITSSVLTVDADSIPAGAVWRTRKEGDVFLRFGGTRQRLKDYFIDKKIPARLRDYVPLLCEDNNVLCVVGFEIADSLRITSKTKNKKEITLDRFALDAFGVL